MRLFIIIPFVFSFCFAQNSWQYQIPKNLNDGWEAADFTTAFSDTAIFNRFFNGIRSENHKLHSFLVIRDDQLVLEEYFKKTDPNKPHDLRSATKSVISLLMGIAIDEGFIESENDPIFKYLKTYSPKKNLDPRKEQITIADLLTMSSGLDCNDWDRNSKGQEDKVYKKKDWLQFTLDLPMINDPGDTSMYCSMGTVMAAEIISQASGMAFDEFAEKYLFKPLGIDNYYWGHTSKRKDILPSAKRLYITSRGFAKIGLMVLNQGLWQGKQVVSSEWIMKSTSKKTQLSGRDYGYLWWKIPFQYKGKKIIGTVATGNGGQYLMIFLELGLLTVFTGGVYNSPDGMFAFMIMNKLVFPALK